MLSKMWDVDAKFAKEASSGFRKGKMQMQLYTTGRIKSICKFEEKQVADIMVKKRASATANIKPCRYNNYKKLSATVNIKSVQIQQLPKKHLRKQITP